MVERGKVGWFKEAHLIGDGGYKVRNDVLQFDSLFKESGSKVWC